MDSIIGYWPPREWSWLVGFPIKISSVFGQGRRPVVAFLLEFLRDDCCVSGLDTGLDGLEEYFWQLTANLL